MSRFKNHVCFGKIRLPFKYLDLNLAFYFPNLTLKVRPRSPIFFIFFCHVHVLNSCKIGQNQPTQSEDNGIIIFLALNLAVFF